MKNIIIFLFTSILFLGCQQATTISTGNKSIDPCQCFERPPCDFHSMNYIYSNRPFIFNECLAAANYAGYYLDDEIIAFLKSQCKDCN